MNSEDRLWAFGITAIAAIMILLGLALFKSCESARDARLECIKAGHSAADCREAFAQ